MHCPSCLHPNPPGAKFCGECGARLPAPCPHCGHANAPGAKFCNDCGQALALPAAPPEKTSPQPPDLQALIPAEYAQQLEAARSQNAVAGERRIVTILFCDVKGSTAAASRFDPEDWAQVINGAFEYMIRPVYQFEGNVARLMGDGILAFFGAPIAHEDDPQRAILAALEIISGFETYKSKILQEWDLALDLRVGINTGLVMVGDVGSDQQMEYTALGDAINIAARMEQTALPGTIQAAEDTYKRSAPLFDWEDLGEMEVKGKETRLRTYRPLRIKPAPGRLRGIAGLDAPLVGRRAEFAQLQDALARLRRGSGGIVFIVGEAGLGKSRLITELKLENQNSGSELPDAGTPALWYEAASLSYESTQPYALFQRLLRRIYGIEENDAPAEKWEKYLPMLQQIPADLADRGGVFEVLFAVHGRSGADLPQGEDFKRQLFDLITLLVVSWTAQAPLVLVLDDLHWTDPASVELLTHFYPLTDQHPLLLICATRPERNAPVWTAKETASREFPHRTREILLASLSAQDTDELVNRLLLVADLPEKLHRQIIEKTDGNPFFIEEVVRVLIDSGAVTREVVDGRVHWRAAADLEQFDLPGNLQTLLTARIDRLEENARRTLQLASVIGRSFYYRVLARVHQAASTVRAELDGQLRALQRAEMILEAARMPELEFTFRHALTQEAAYNTILLRQRRAFHQQVGEALETLFAERLEEFYPMLAHHFREAQDPRAQRYETLAGDAAFRLFAIPEAASHYRRALDAALRSPHAGPELTRLFKQLGRCFELQSEHQSALETYDRMIAHARRQQDPQMELAGMVVLATLLATPNLVQDADRSKKLSGEALEIAARLGDQEIESRIHWNLLLAEMYSGFMDLGIPHGEKAVDVARRLGQQEQLAHALQDLALAYMAVGDLKNGRKVLEDAQPLWALLNNQPMLAENWTNLAFERLMAGNFETAVEMMDRGYEISDRIRNEWGRVNNRGFVSHVYFARGDFDKAADLIAEYLPRARKVGHPASGIMLIQRSWIYSHLGLPELALQAAQEAIEDVRGFGPFLYYAMAETTRCLLNLGETGQASKLLEEASALKMQRTLLEVDISYAMIHVEAALATGEMDKAREEMQAVLALIRRAGAPFFLPEALLLQARLYRLENDLASARRTLEEARAVALEIQFRPFLWRIHAALAQVCDALGEAATAEAERAAARSVVGQIQSRLRDPAQRTALAAFADRFLIG